MHPTKKETHTRIYVAQEFNVTKIALMSSIDEGFLQTDNK